METKIQPITLNIYADSPEEAQRGRHAIVQFINILGQYGAKVSGDKLAQAVAKLNDNKFILSQIIQFFKQ